MLDMHDRWLFGRPYTVCVSSAANINSAVDRSVRFVICVDILETSAVVFSGDQSLQVRQSATLI